MDNLPPVELLEASHQFPGVYQIKAIGSVGDNFETRVLDAVRRELAEESALNYTSRTTPGGRHVALTLQLNARTAEQVRQIYARIHEQSGLLYLL